jgi:hypothetical protein
VITNDVIMTGYNTPVEMGGDRQEYRRVGGKAAGMWRECGMGSKWIKKGINKRIM